MAEEILGIMEDPIESAIIDLNNNYDGSISNL